MKTLLYISIFLLSVIGCKSDNEPGPDGLLKELSGSWELVEIETGVISQTKWEPIASGQEKIIRFRTDGLIVNEKDQPICCMPQAIILNGQLLRLEPKDNLPSNPSCKYLDCMGAVVWEMTLQSEELIILNCCLNKEKYRRK
ncbi:hypothetical protein [Dyadobacter tibetensis]|uniref:hypothetical protein n=1 Tax=Dyadobacter tibetensis TaxID=1211851 RepID=UPI000471DE23|nr:hypothetical protein [Dyadobacter tibetensis]